jgi:glycosyltransferase involved in cell wall biosynthesis
MLAGAVDRLLLDEEARRALGAKARARVTRYFSEDAMACSYQQMWRAVAAKRDALALDK